MNPKLVQLPPDRRNHLETIERAAREAVREALRRHMLLGEFVAVGDESGRVQLLGPDEIRQALKAA